MHIQLNSLKKKLLDDNFYKGKNLFYNKCNNYHYSRVATFGRLFNILVIGLEIFTPSALQVNSNKTWNYSTRERIKLKIIKDCVFMGTKMFEERKEEFLTTTVKSSPPYIKCFYISQQSLDTFIKEILIPLLKLVENANDYNWNLIDGKKGFWREYDKATGFKLDEEIYINPLNDKKMIKLS